MAPGRDGPSPKWGGRQRSAPRWQRGGESACCCRISSDSKAGGAILTPEGTAAMIQAREDALLGRITVDPDIFGGKPIIRGRRLAVEHVLGMLAAGDSVDDLLREYPWLERDDVQACLVYARRLVGHERVEPAVQSPGA